MPPRLTLMIVTLLLLAGPVRPGLAEETSAETTPSAPQSEADASSTPTPETLEDHTGVQLIQPNRILFTMIDFREYEQVRQIHEQMLSIPGLTDFIPQLEAPGLLTYDLRYSGPSELLIQALQDVFGAQYEIAMKEMGENEWEFTMRRSSQTNVAYD